MQKVLNLNLEQMKIISDQNKINILNCFELDKPLSINEVAEKLGISYSKVNYQIKTLEKVGLLEVVDTKIKSGIIEKYYLPTAEEFRIDKSISIIDGADGGEYKKRIKKFYDSIFKGVTEDYKSLLENITSDTFDNIAMINSTIFLTEEEARELKNEIQENFKVILDKYGDKRENTQAYNIASFLLKRKNQKQYFD
ncbi:hypothetical protein Q428_10925 [Fervidicella metallireducens AeB]|uniref:ArsR family transcriptional regulator n=1 Tax=Fervidicella metallireducens AeB TaxID=1403537 RepID=A0A017RTE9_9CLOT|nr:winged helix-turn-helix domain-containing protein [Fervidicella metallireducens]EYE87886.1 hypothetical protein Q428_10925 [Fervidicella metallireducens AeB]